jgi:hypothetical protein
MEDEEGGSFFPECASRKERVHVQDSDSEGGGEHVCSIIDMTEPNEGANHNTHVKVSVENGSTLRNPNVLNGHTDFKA